MITRPITRGDIVFVNFGEQSGSVQGGYRPAVVLQRDRYNKSSQTTIVAPLTTVIKRKRMATHVYIGNRFGLPERSMLLLEQIQTIDKSEIDTYLGHIDDENLFCKINQGLRKVLAIKNEELDPTYVLKRPRLSEGYVERKKEKKK
jgi:mRNA interferase MazF